MAIIKIMTFNVRQMDGEDGDQSWQYRKDVLIQTIQDSSPLIIGTQETWPEQTDHILAAFPAYRSFGRGRFGDNRDKHNKVFYDAARLDLLDSGDIWISRTPELAGTMDWDIPSPRMISWGLLRLDGANDFVFLNTHFPYGRGGDEARRQTARLILEKIATLPSHQPIIMTGDFNARPDGEIHQSLCAVLSDAWQEAEQRHGPEGTVHGFGKMASGPRIDWILCRHIKRVLSVETITFQARGLYPSDHYPVCATLEL